MLNQHGSQSQYPLMSVSYYPKQIDSSTSYVTSPFYTGADSISYSLHSSTSGSVDSYLSRYPEGDPSDNPKFKFPLIPQRISIHRNSGFEKVRGHFSSSQNVERERPRKLNVRGQSTGFLKISNSNVNSSELKAKLASNELPENGESFKGRKSNESQSQKKSRKETQIKIGKRKTLERVKRVQKDSIPQTKKNNKRKSVFSSKKPPNNKLSKSKARQSFSTYESRNNVVQTEQITLEGFFGAKLEVIQQELREYLRTEQNLPIIFPGDNFKFRMEHEKSKVPRVNKHRLKAAYENSPTPQLSRAYYGKPKHCTCRSSKCLKTCEWSLTSSESLRDA